MVCKMFLVSRNFVSHIEKLIISKLILFYCVKVKLKLRNHSDDLKKHNMISIVGDRAKYLKSMVPIKWTKSPLYEHYKQVQIKINLKKLRFCRFFEILFSYFEQLVHISQKV